MKVNREGAKDAKMKEERRKKRILGVLSVLGGEMIS